MSKCEVHTRPNVNLHAAQSLLLNSVTCVSMQLSCKANAVCNTLRPLKPLSTTVECSEFMQLPLMYCQHLSTYRRLYKVIL